MDAAGQADRIAAAVIVFAVLLVVLGVTYYLGAMRARAAKAEAKRVREEERAFWREMFGKVDAAIRSESALRVAAENERLFRRTIRPSE
jgi:uncharacterized membrane protein